jgi:glycosyl transferase family 25
VTADPPVDGLPPFWVVSLERATERRAFVSTVYDDLGVEPVIIDAVDGQQLTDSQLASYSDLRATFSYGRSLSRAEIAIALSHLSICRRMVDEQIEEVVVLEDDVRPTPELLDVLAARSSFPIDFDVMTLHSLFEWATPTPVDDQVLAGGFRVCRYARTPMGAQAYLLRRPGAARLLDVAFPVRLPADELLFRPHPAHLAVYGIEPSPVRHDEFPSELHRVPPPPNERPWWEQAMLRGVQWAGRVQHRLRDMSWRRSH